ncbi:HAD family hydrolase [Candidatus Kaiserbacteria bacterium]|nr:HAD family hydrolase [Candidatus Kaiserbacteria bacterium]
MDIQAVICDCDGPILDSFREGLRRIKILCAFHDVPYGLAERRRLTEAWGAPGVVLLEKGLGISAELAKAMYERWEKFDLSEPVPHVPGAREVLYWLRRNDIKAVLLTSRNRENITAIFDRMDFLREFAFLSTRDDFYYAKPDPRAFRYALETLRSDLGIHREQCIFVGDTPADILGGAQASLTTVVVQTGPYMLEHTKQYPIALENIISSIDELPAWMEKHHEGMIRYEYY